MAATTTKRGHSCLLCFEFASLRVAALQGELVAAVAFDHRLNNSNT